MECVNVISPAIFLEIKTYARKSVHYRKQFFNFTFPYVIDRIALQETSL